MNLEVVLTVAPPLTAYASYRVSGGNRKWNTLKAVFRVWNECILVREIGLNVSLNPADRNTWADISLTRRIEIRNSAETDPLHPFLAQILL
jgi:hypothetical protein